MTTVGLLRPEGHPEDDYRRIETLLGSDIRVDPVVYQGQGHGADPGRLAAGAERLRLAGADAVVWASASGSFAPGWDAARERARSLALAAGIPASSTAIGFAHAVRAVGATRVVVAGTRSEDLAGAARFLGAAGVEVVGEWRGAGRLPLPELVRAADDPRAEALLVPDTAVPTVAEVPEAEAAVGKPVLTGTLVTVWEGLRLAERHGAWADELGALFVRRGPRDVWEPGE